MAIDTAQQVLRTRPKSLSASLLGLLVVVCLACSYLMGPAMAMVPQMPILGFPLLLATLGSVMAQGCLLAAWLAWSEQPFWDRLLLHWVIAASLYLVWAAGLALGLPERFVMASTLVGLSVPLVSIAAQLPLWFVRQAFGWRLVLGDTNQVAGARSLSIRDLMLATVLVGLSLAPARWIVSPDGKEMETPGLVLFLAATLISAMTLLPTAPLLLRTGRWQRGVLYAILYGAFWAVLPWVIVLVARNRGWMAGPPALILIGLSCLIVSFAGTVILAATVARTYGYRLAIGWQPSP